MASIAKKVLPENEPITLEQAKEYLIVEDSYNDNLINRLIPSVRSEIEGLAAMALPTQQVTFIANSSMRNYGNLKGILYKAIELLPVRIIQSLTSIAYEGQDSGSWVDVPLEDCKIVGDRKITIDNFVLGARFKAVYQAGYTSNDDIPPEYIQAMYELLAFRYTNREGGAIPTAITSKFAGMRGI